MRAVNNTVSAGLLSVIGHEVPNATRAAAWTQARSLRIAQRAHERSNLLGFAQAAFRALFGRADCDIAQLRARARLGSPTCKI